MKSVQAQRFAPIAIVGRACVLPGALSPAELWQAVSTGCDLVRRVAQGRWRVAPEAVLCAPDTPRPDHCWNDRGGYLQGFESVWNPNGFSVPAEHLDGLDPLFHWVLHCAREALTEAKSSKPARSGAVFGNLGFPSEQMAAYAESVWTGKGSVDPRNRFMSSGCADLLERALKLGAGSHCLDAACASSLYALKLACDRLQEGSADLMLAGAVQRADDLFLHQGFAALNALSRSGQSRPFHRDADGLLPAEGAAFFALKRLQDARRDGDTIYGVIRGLGLSNDGRGKGLLVPDALGQQRAIRAAFAGSGLRPADVSLLECHATGTTVGDAAELCSTAAEYASANGLPIGSLKSNLGHLITVAGAAGLIKVLAAMQAGKRPPTLHVDSPTPALENTPFRLLSTLEDWPNDGPRVAAVSAFGFGGNNAHLLVSEEHPSIEALPAERPSGRIAMVSLSCQAAQCADRGQLASALFNGATPLDAASERPIVSFELALDGLRVPPSDLQQALPQQLIMLRLAAEVVAEADIASGSTTAVYLGMEPDPEVARYSLRWRNAASLTADQRDAIVPALTSAAVLGCMPNIPANRLNSQFDLAGPGFTVQAGGASGSVCLRLALGALRRGEVDAALVGAVDFSCETVHRAAASALGMPTPAADAAIMCVLKRAEDAERDGDSVLAYFEQDDTPGDGDQLALPVEKLGHAYAAQGMLKIAAEVLSLHYRRHRHGRPWLAPAPRRIAHSEAGSSSVVEAVDCYPSIVPTQQLVCFAAENRTALIDALQRNCSGYQGQTRLVLVTNPEQLDDLRSQAIRYLQSGAAAPAPGIYYRERPLEGGLAFAFTGAGAAYHGMGRELLQQLPALMDRLAKNSAELAMGLHWAYQTRQTPSALQQLQGASALSQVHADLSQNLLDLRADAWLGYSSGETNALFAAGVWQDADGLMRDMQASGLMEREIGGGFEAVSRTWGRPADWANWSLLAPMDTVVAALKNEPQVHLAIIQSDQECIIAGDADGCARVVERVGRNRCLRMSYALAVHVPELKTVASAWLDLHRRPSQAPRTGRLYSSAWGQSYEPSDKRCADAILQQALQPLDLRPAIRRAWDDGIRIFIEHGPGSSYARAIRSTLADREALVLSLDRKGQGIDGLLHVAAALLAAGRAVNLQALQPEPAFGDRSQNGYPASERRAAEWPRQDSAAVNRRLSITAHRTPVAFPPAAEHKPLDNTPSRSAIQVQRMTKAPRLPSVLQRARMHDQPLAAHVVGMVSNAQPQAVTHSTNPIPHASASSERAVPSPPALLQMRQHQQQLSEMQLQFVRRQAELHQRFLALREAGLQHLLRSATHGVSSTASALGSLAAEAATMPKTMPGTFSPPPALLAAVVAPSAGSANDDVDQQQATNLAAPTKLAPPALPTSQVASAALAPSRRQPSGPMFSREQLQVHAGGTISTLFGPQFANQDGYARQVRMPQPPLLLADRVIGLEAEPDSMGSGCIWTETDVSGDAWYLHQGRMPAGVMIEAGQADLMLISYVGVDRLNRGERVYRLLGCELTYHGDLPAVGETLRFEIQLDGHAAQGDVRLMFFHYDCHNGDRLQLSVRKGQAGFFTEQELAESAGCLWSAEKQSIVESPRLDPPAVPCTRNSFAPEQLAAFARGDVYNCFGRGFEFAQTHTRSPSIQAGRMLLQDRVVSLDTKGGPWQRGYLRAELDIRPDHWFFDGHFKNDPCMPGTLMFEGCLQMLAFYLAASGHSLRCDGWRFQPVPDLPYQLQCRGQVLPSSKCLVTEVFVEELIAGPIPTVYADLLCTVDGLKAFHARRVALQLVPDWPISSEPDVSETQDSKVAVVDGFRFDRNSLLACATGRPSQAFGPMYRRFDGPMRVARLPSPPYHFISRIAEVHGPIGVMQAGARVVAEYDLPDDVWYLDQNGCRCMPFAVLLEAALQPCGWLSSYVGSALTEDNELGFRNLDGEGRVLAELEGGAGVLRTEVELVSVSATAGMIIEAFQVRCHLNDLPVYNLSTVFGFFPPEALAAQAGLPKVAEQSELLLRAANQDKDLSMLGIDADRQPGLALPGAMLRMIDRLQGYWPESGKAGLGQLRAVKQIDANEWFFKAHFFQDPVQPGSLGLEAMLQLLQVYLIESGAAEGIASPRFECMALDQAHQWKYRGQVLPHHKEVQTTLEITACTRDEHGVLAVAKGSLWADGQRIYEASGLAVRVVSGGAI